ncbi:MAG: ABC transporter ATP-binding protein, partial [Oscillospiraceae bacterium]
MFLSMPAPMRIYAAVQSDKPCPVTVRDGRLWLNNFAATHLVEEKNISKEKQKICGNTDKSVSAIELEDLWFRYEKDLPDVIKGLSLKIEKGEFLAILGGNGTGKTTALSLISGISRPYRGRVKVNGKELSKPGDRILGGLMGVLPQNPQALFVKKTVYEDLLESLQGRGFTGDEEERRLAGVSRLCRLGGLFGRHPYDLSGGEQQRVALAEVLLLEPRILLLDEPTKGLDAEFKQIFAGILERLVSRGVTVIMVSHDIEFCAKYAHRCALFFDGHIVTDDTPRAFFSGNCFYTTSANRMARKLLPEAVTAEDVIAACGGEVPPEPEQTAENENDELLSESCFEFAEKKMTKLPPWRSAIAWAAGVIVIISAYLSLAEPNIPWLMNQNRKGLYIVLIAAGLSLAMAVSRRGESNTENLRAPANQRKLSKRTVLAAAMILLVIPLTIYLGICFFGDRKYYFISLLIIVETLLPFTLIFEGRRPQARELVIIAVLCALGVAGRAAF